MGVYINTGYKPAENEQPFRHIAGGCRLLQERVDQGFAASYVNNTEGVRKATQRCPECFRDLPVITEAEQRPEFLERVTIAVREAGPGSSFVYNVYDPDGMNSQVGKADNPVSRLQARWRATIKGGYSEDVIPWLNERLQADPSYEPEVEITAFANSDAALAGEQDLRNELRDEGWYVSSMV